MAVSAKHLEVDTSKITDGVFSHLEAKVGQTPYGYNGYRIKKTTYSKQVFRATGISTDVFTDQKPVFVYKLDRTSRGYNIITEVKTPDGGSPTDVAGYDFINEDQEGGDGTTGLSNGNRLNDGDILLGAILTVQDNRHADARDGTLYGAMVASSSTTVNGSTIYGHAKSTFQSDLSTYRIGTKMERAAAATSRMSTCVLAQQDALYRFSSVAADEDAGAPFIAVGMGGIINSTNSIRVELVIYSLAAITVNDAPSGASATPTFDLKDLLCYNLNQHVYYS
jgi:hypothetical protein